MDSPVNAAGSDAPLEAPREVELEVRVAPKIWAFLGAGFVLGAVAALVTAWVGHGLQAAEAAKTGDVAEFTFMSALGFFTVFLGIAGIALGALAYLIVDRLGRRNARRVRSVIEPLGDEANPKA